MKDHNQTINNAPASITLGELAKKPYDLTGSDALVTDNRLRNYISVSDQFRLIYATQRVDDRVLDALQQLADQCGLVEQFKAMCRGHVINMIHGYESECRQVLHTATRDIFSSKPKEVDAATQAAVELEKLKTFLQEIDQGVVKNQNGGTFTTMIHVGIGGSDLGPRSIYEALKAYGLPGRKVIFVANVDPDDVAAAMDGVDLSHTLVNIVSKSGTTLETLTNEQLVIKRLRAEGLDPAKHCIAVTGQGSPMDNPEKYLRSFYMFDYIGGRFSSTSMVGAVMLGFYLGYEPLLEFLKGASQLDNEAECEDIRKNIPLLMALLGIWNHNFLEAPTLAVLPYSQALHRFPAHLQQCDMESNGKSIDRMGNPTNHKTGPVIWGEPGTNGQHAFYQLLHQGTEIVPAEFIGFLNSQYQQDLLVEDTSSQEKLLANLLAQAMGLACGQFNENPNKQFHGNRPSSILIGERLTPRSMGGLLALYEAKIAFQGFAWGINSFDQEGVQLGKVLATRILEIIKNPEDGEESAELQMLQAASTDLKRGK